MLSINVPLSCLSNKQRIAPNWKALIVGSTRPIRIRLLASNNAIALVRFLVVAPERTELVRHKLERSPLLREAIARDNWHIIKWNHMSAFLARDPLDVGDLEPYVGLDPQVERSGEQMPLFEG